jgi:hypothetical protein
MSVRWLDCCAAARVRSAVRFPRDTLDPAGRRGGGWRTGARARRRDGRPDSRVLLCAGSVGTGQRCALRMAADAAPARGGVWPPALDLAGWASLPSSPAAAGNNLGFAQVLHGVSALRVQPAAAGGTAGPLLPPTPAIPAPVAVV